VQFETRAIAALRIMMAASEKAAQPHHHRQQHLQHTLHDADPLVIDAGVRPLNFVPRR